MGCSSSASRATSSSGRGGTSRKGYLVAQVSSAAPSGETRRSAGREAPVTGSRRVTATAWVLVTALSLAGAVLTVLAFGDLVISDRITNLWAAPSAVLYATLGTLVV